MHGQKDCQGAVKNLQTLQYRDQALQLCHTCAGSCPDVMVCYQRSACRYIVSRSANHIVAWVARLQRVGRCSGNVAIRRGGSPSRVSRCWCGCRRLDRGLWCCSRMTNKRQESLESQNPSFEVKPSWEGKAGQVLNSQCKPNAVTFIQKAMAASNRLTAQQPARKPYQALGRWLGKRMFPCQASGEQ
jgi:hypothetical protein